MRISSNYYNYYTNLYSSNTISNQNTNSEEVSSSENIADVLTIPRKKPTYEESGSITDLDFSVRRLMHDMKMQDNDTSEISESMNKIKADMDEIKTTDIDSLSTDDLKETLANLINDINSARKPHEGYNNDLQVDLDNMSEEDMREMLQKIQDNAE